MPGGGGGVDVRALRIQEMVAFRIFIHSVFFDEAKRI